jgi:hypothetical protein
LRSPSRINIYNLCPERVFVIVEESLLESCRKEVESYKNLCKYFLNEYSRGELLSDLCACLSPSIWVMLCYLFSMFICLCVYFMVE